MIHGSDNGYVARLQKGTLEPKTVWANAHLIAAAPDLLAACKALVARSEERELESGDRCHGCGTMTADHTDYCEMERARTAIAKAEGGAS